MKFSKRLVIQYLFMFIFAGSCSSNSSRVVTKNHLYTESQSLDDSITVKSDVIGNLKSILKEKKFGPEPSSSKRAYGYVGFLPPESRPIANKLLNQSITELITVLQKNKRVTKRMILNEIEKGLNSFNELAVDTEDRERLCYYFEDIMSMIGLESSNELLNNWMYQ